MIYNCRFCNNNIKDAPSEKRKYCNRKCRASFLRTQIESKAPNWKNAKTVHANGYLIISRQGRTFLEHDFIMSKYLGRPLVTGEIVHHINGNKKDNRLENLELMTRSTHMKRHIKEYKYKEFVRYE